MAEKEALGVSRDKARDKIIAKTNEEKTARSELKFSNVESIESQIRELEARQSRTSMTLNDEKKIIKEIKALQMSKKTLAGLAELRAAIEALKVEKSAIDKSYNDKMAELREVGDRIGAQREVLDALNKDNSTKSEAVPAYRARQNELKKLIDDKYQAIKTLRSEFKAKEEAYYAQLAEERARKKEQKQKEMEARQAEEEARKKAL
jgi:uncharacterized coiled-coil DUF342 family protein